MSFVVFNPTSGPSLKEIHMAKREKPLHGSVLGIIDNGKMNSDTVVNAVAERLKEKYFLKEIIHHRKPSFSHGLNESSATMLAEKCDFIISGVGD